MIDKRDGRYEVDKDEDTEPRSDGLVLKNYLGITSVEEIERVEEIQLLKIVDDLEKYFNKSHRFSSKDICAIHEGWLGSIYPSAGKYRSVNMTKGGFPFASAMQIEKLMDEFEKKYLAHFTPCIFKDLEQVIQALAVVHVEFIIIHPFREGNGRVGRLVANLMASQADLPPLDFEIIDQNVNQEGFSRYIEAIHFGFCGNYIPMENIFREVIKIIQQKV